MLLGGLLQRLYVGRSISVISSVGFHPLYEPYANLIYVAAVSLTGNIISHILILPNILSECHSLMKVSHPGLVEKVLPQSKKTSAID